VWRTAEFFKPHASDVGNMARFILALPAALPAEQQAGEVGYLCPSCESWPHTSACWWSVEQFEKRDKEKHDGVADKLRAECHKFRELYQDEEREHLSAIAALDKARTEVESLRKERDEARQGAELCCEEPETCTDKCAWREAHALRTTCRTLACELAAAVGKAVDNG